MGVDARLSVAQIFFGQTATLCTPNLSERTGQIISKTLCGARRHPSHRLSEKHFENERCGAEHDAVLNAALLQGLEPPTDLRPFKFPVAPDDGATEARVGGGVDSIIALRPRSAEQRAYLQTPDRAGMWQAPQPPLAFLRAMRHAHCFQSCAARQRNAGPAHRANIGEVPLRPQ